MITKSLYLTLSLGLSSLYAIAQPIASHYKTHVDDPKQNGYHQILLSAEVTGRSARDFADLRLFDQEQRETPYLITEETFSSQRLDFKTYPLVDKSYNRSWSYESRYVIENTNPEAIQSLVLKIRNFSDRRHVRLSGSDDRKEWFIVKDGYTLHDVFSETETFAYKVLHFPLSDYKYLKVEVDDDWNRHHGRNHINITEFGYFETAYDLGQFTQADAPTIHQSDSSQLKQSFVDIKFPYPVALNQLHFDVSNADSYHRRATLQQKYWLDDTTFRFKNVTSFWLSSTTLNHKNVSVLRGQEFRLVIENKDNAPVQVRSVLGLQLKKHLTAKLDSNSIYTLYFDHDAWTKPEYDLVYFKNEIPKQLPLLETGAIQFIPTAKAEPEAPTPFLRSPLFLWTSIGGVVLLFGFMSYRMMRDIGKRNS